MNNDQLENIRATLLKERAAKELAEKELQLLKLEYTAMFQNLADAYLVISLSGEVLKMNGKAKEILGYDIDKEGFNLMQIALPNESQKITTSFKELVEEGVLTNFRSHIKTKDGEIKYASVNASIIYDENNNAVAAQGIVRDITGRYIQEQKLIESEKRLYTLVSGKNMGVVLSDENHKILSVNDKLFELFQLPIDKESMVGQNALNVIEKVKDNFQNSDEFLENAKAILRNKKVIEGGTLTTRSGKILERDFTPIYIDKVYKGNLSTYRDITIEKKYDKGIEAEKSKYESIINNTNLGLVEFDLEERIITVNNKLSKMYDLPKGEVIGNKIRDLFPHKNVAALMDNIQSNLKTPTPKPYEITIDTNSGEKRYWLISVAPNYDIKGEFVSFIGAHTDITHLKKLELQKDNLLGKLSKSNKELHDYAHMVSHDLKSPLRNIDTLTLWLSQDYKSKFDENGIKTLDLIRSNVERMENLISGILMYSSLDKDKIEFYDINLNGLVNEIIALIHMPEHISVKVINKLPKIKGDRFRIQQLFQNLIVNAINFNDKSAGKIEISCNDDGNYWKFCIKDNGEGIKQNYLKKIFNVFEKLNTDVRSTGIGLSIAKKIVEVYKGNIYAESELGKGTKIYFTLKKF